jgi:6-phosphofructokinase
MTMDASHLPGLARKHVNVAMMTSGGLAPCLSSSIAHLMMGWIQALKEGKISGLTFRMYIGGYKGLLIGDSFVVPESEWDMVDQLNQLGGSPIGNSRVKVKSTEIITFAYRKGQCLTIHLRTVDQHYGLH